MTQDKNPSEGIRPYAIALALTLAGWLALMVSIAYAQGGVAIVNGASFRTEQPVAAGGWVSAFGTFANVGETSALSLPLPKNLGGVTVTVGGLQAPINYVSANQINFVIPYQTPPGLQSVEITTPGGTLSGSVRVITAAPGVFTIFETPQPTPPRGAILNQDFSLNAQDRPAIRGQVIQIFATGHSTLSQQIADGAAGPAAPLIETQVEPQVFVGGVECDVEFSGLAPGFAALWQINARIPQFSFLSGKIPVQIFMNGVDSNEVSIYVAP
jgi:uncharacterized protein (TIGR03437 family)